MASPTDYSTTILIRDKGAVQPDGGPEQDSSTGMERRQLLENFQSILRSHAIFYPVAYRFLRKIGEGRQGVVFLAERQGSRGCITQHAVKIFDPSIYGSVREYWTDMGRIAAQVSRLHSSRSPNLSDCDIYEETNGIGYIQMEMVEGLDLRQFLSLCQRRYLHQGEPLETDVPFIRTILNRHHDRLCIQPGVAIHIMRQMLHGLEHLSTARYLHCDIKPSNAMIDPLGYIKLIDFGRAVMLDETHHPLVGTPLYMAPESHQRKPITIQSDIYSIGLVGLELLRGCRLLEDPGAGEEDLLRVKLELPSRLESLLPPYVRINRLLVQILHRMLDPDPAQRFQTPQAAQSRAEGLAMVHKQLAKMEIDADYYRDLARFMRLLGRS